MGEGGGVASSAAIYELVYYILASTHNILYYAHTSESTDTTYIHDVVVFVV